MTMLSPLHSQPTIDISYSYYTQVPVKILPVKNAVLYLKHIEFKKHVENSLIHFWNTSFKAFWKKNLSYIIWTFTISGHEESYIHLQLRDFKEKHSKMMPKVFFFSQNLLLHSSVCK